MKSKYWHLLCACFLSAALTLSGCGGGGSSNPGNPSQPSNPGSGTPQNGAVTMVVSDDSTQDWAMIGVKILSIGLVPQGGGNAVNVYTAPSPTPMFNLVQLDQLGELLGNLQVAAGTYTGAVLTISGNPGDVALTTSADPETGFAGMASTNIPSSQIQIKGTQGANGSLTVPVKVNFSSPLVVTANQDSALDIEFDLAHPAFIVDHVPANGGATIWAVNFNGTVRHHPLRDITRLILRHMYGTVTAVASDNSSITITRDFPEEPAANPETAVQSSQSLTILADNTNGTIFYDVDAKTRSVIKDFSSVASSLNGKFVRIAARYQQNGTLVAVRIWASTSFNNVWFSPEGHVLHVNRTTDVIAVQNEDGTPIPITVDANTQFFYRTPANALADSQPIATGTAFLANQNLVRGFKVHVSVDDPLANPLVAQTVDIEIAKFNGAITSSSASGFTDTAKFFISSDDYSVQLGYISSSTPNGKDANGNPITGFKWWNFAFPTLLDSGTNAVQDFVNATNGTVNFGGSVGPLTVLGSNYMTWNDPANPNAWSTKFSILVPDNIPRGAVASPFASTQNGGSFGMTANGGANAVTVDLSSVSGSATLVYQIDKTNGIVTISAEDITTSSGLSAVQSNLINGTPVKVFGLPQSDGTIKAYVLFYYTGDMPSPTT